MNEGHSEIDKYLLGTTLIVALIIGGASRPGLTTELIIQMVTIATSTFVCMRHMDRPIDKRVFWFMIAVCLAILLQIVPISSEQIRSTQGILLENDPVGELTPLSISLGLGRTVEVLGYFLTLCLFLTAVLKLRFDQVYGLIPFFLTGVVLNLTAGLIQYSYSGQAIITDLLSYELKAGFFINVNHFSSLIFTSIPIAFVYFIETNRLILLFAYIVTALLILLAAGSAAGVMIGFAITVLSVLILFQRNRAGILAVLAGTIVAGIYSIGLWARLQVEEVNLGYGRLEFARTTIEGIRDNLPFGIGYGNFVIGYPSYERGEMIFNTFVNNAHNEYLELLFEGGVVAAVLLLVFFILIVWRILETIRMPLHKAATLAILFVLVHSIVDYPLRGFGMAFPFTLFIAFLFHHGPEMADLPRENHGPSQNKLAVDDLI